MTAPNLRRRQTSRARRALLWEIRTVAIDPSRTGPLAVDDCSGCGCEGSGCPAPMLVQPRRPARKARG